MKYIENEKLLELRFSNGMLILPWYYSHIKGKINAAKFSGDGIVPIPFGKRLWNIIKEITHLSVKQKDILIFTSTLFNAKNERGEYFNTLHGYYYDIYKDDVMMIEDGDMNNKWRTTHLYPNISHCNSFATFFIELLARVVGKIRPINNPDYDIIIDCYPDVINKRALIVADYYSRFYATFLRYLIKKIKPKTIIVNCGTYGYLYGVICKVAHEYDIKVIEPQHGQIYRHVIYSVSPIIREHKEYRKYIPDYLYTFGNYWNKNIEWNYEKIVVGNPYLNDFVKKLSTSKQGEGIIIISQPNGKEHQIPFIKDLSSLLPNESITVRFHPIENIEEQKKEFIGFSNIRFSDSSKILYQDLLDHRYVVGWNSTCLFELLAFKRIPFIVESPMSRGHFPDEVGTWVRNASELADYIRRNEEPKVNNFEDFWAINFEGNVKTHIDQIIQNKA